MTSPYLTSDAAEKVIGQADPATSVVLTTFDAETFASGGSSLGTLTKLLKAGYNVRALERLHAKLVVTERAVFVGSQNLTAAGTRNKEATALLTTHEEVRYVREASAEWIAASQPITLAMVNDMEERLLPLQKLARELSRACQLVDADIAKAAEDRERQQWEAQEANNRENREAEERRRQEAEEREAEQRRQEQAQKANIALKRSVRAARPARGRIPLSLEQRTSRAEYGSSLQTYWTLIAPDGTDMTRWTFTDQHVQELVKANRYMLVAPETGRIGWPSLYKTRLTRFGTNIRRSNQVQLEGAAYAIDVISNQDAATLRDWNVEFRLRSIDELDGISVFALYSLTGLQIHRIKDDPTGHLGTEFIRELLQDDGGAFAGKLKEAVLSPFKYKTKNRSTGVSPLQFCEGLRRPITLRLRQHGNYPFLSLESSGFISA